MKLWFGTHLYKFCLKAHALRFKHAEVWKDIAYPNVPEKKRPPDHMAQSMLEMSCIVRNLYSWFLDRSHTDRTVQP